MLKAVERPGVQEDYKSLVERVAASRFIGKSARLRDLLIYLCNRVLDDNAVGIHEQEVGHSVFGRPRDYDTTIDNIVRVHASQLRKRLAQYFSSDGAGEAWIIEIPKGNYAPVFLERTAAPISADPILAEAEMPLAEVAGGSARSTWTLTWILAALVVLFAASTAVLFAKWRAASSASTVARASDKPTVGLFWSQVFRSGQPTDIVLDDATFGLFQEFTGKPMGIADYFDRSYLRKLDDLAAGSKFDSKQVNALVLRRYSSYASSHLLWRLFQAAGPLQSQSTVYFARDYGFRGIKNDNVILLGNNRSNPWIESLDNRLGIRWTFQDALGIYTPEDKLASGDAGRYKIAADPAEREGYFMVALLPNQGGSGKVLILAATGGSAINAGADFLMDEPSMARLRSMIPTGKAGEFPDFEGLLRFRSRSSLPKDQEILLARRLTH